MGYSPWADLATRHPDVHVERCEIAPVKGVWVPSERVILLDRALDVAGRRSTLAHEIAHIDLGHREQDGWFAARAERDADRLAAQRLLTVTAIADAICVHPLDQWAVADHLSVTRAVLVKRLRMLTDEEKTYIERRLAACDRGA